MQREAKLLESLAHSGTFAQQARYHDLNLRLERRSLTQEEHNELRELIAQSEAQTVQRLSLLYYPPKCAAWYDQEKKGE